MIFFLGI